MDDLHYEGEKFVGVYSSTDKMLEAASKYAKECSSTPDLFFNEVDLDGLPTNEFRQAKLTLKYVVEEYESSI